MLQNCRQKPFAFNPKETAKNIIYMTESAVYGLGWAAHYNMSICIVLDCLQMMMVHGVCKQLQAACRYIHGLTSCNESSPIMHQTNYFLCVGANGYWWVYVSVSWSSMFVFPSQFFSPVGEFINRKCIFFKTGFFW
jgi:hypothetical protein